MSFIKTTLPSAAIAAALDYADVDYGEAYCTLAARAEGYYAIAFRTDYLKYDCYVDEESLEVVGFSFEPIPEREPVEYRTDSELWACCAAIMAAND